MRRRIRQAETGDLTPPTDTRICYVEDWISEDEISTHTFTEDCPAPGHASGGYADCELHLGRDAQHRHAEHRAEWLAQHNVPKADQFRVWPDHRARWRSATGPQPHEAPQRWARAGRSMAGACPCQGVRGSVSRTSVDHIVDLPPPIVRRSGSRCSPSPTGSSTVRGRLRSV